MIERNQFGSHPSESPHDHIADFTERSNIIIAKDLSMEAVCMRLFPFILKDKAKSWLQSEPAGIYRTWEELANGFLAKFYPPWKTSQIQTQLQTFKQRPFESFYEAWKTSNLSVLTIKYLISCSPSSSKEDCLMSTSRRLRLHVVATWTICSQMTSWDSLKLWPKMVSHGAMREA